MAPDKHRFGWTKFYETIADKLLTYRNDRGALVEGIREISVRVDGLGHLAEDKYADGTTGFGSGSSRIRKAEDVLPLTLTFTLEVLIQEKEMPSTCRAQRRQRSTSTPAAR